MTDHKKRIVVIGGGTGASMVLRGLKSHPVFLSVVVSMADSGGSSGVLRRELGVLPGGDIRQCLLGFSEAESELQELFRYRFTEGALKGHNAGNLILAALEKTTGSFEEAVDVAGRMLKVSGEVLPVTVTNTELGVIHGPAGERVMGEHVIDENLPLKEPRTFFLEPSAVITSRARTAIVQADVIVIGPGSLSTSLIPALIVDGVREAIAESHAKIVFNVNLTTTPGQTDGYTVVDYLRDVQTYLPRPVDFVTYHNADIPREAEIHLEAGATFVGLGTPSEEESRRIIGANLLGQELGHDPRALAEVIMKYVA